MTHRVAISQRFVGECRSLPANLCVSRFRLTWSSTPLFGHLPLAGRVQVLCSLAVGNFADFRLPRRECVTLAPFLTHPGPLHFRAPERKLMSTLKGAIAFCKWKSIIGKLVCISLEGCSMKRVTVLSLAVLVASAGAAAFAADFKSGLQVGGFATAYNVKDITGPNKGKTLCYR